MKFYLIWEIQLFYPNKKLKYKVFQKLFKNEGNSITIISNAMHFNFLKLLKYIIQTQRLKEDDKCENIKSMFGFKLISDELL